jgi:Icc protein
VSRVLQFFQLTDPHIAVGANQVQFGLDTTAALRRVLRAVLEAAPPDFVLITGDLVADGRPESYEAFRDLVSSLSVPVHCALGNHDERTSFRRVVLGNGRASDAPYCHAFRAEETDFLVLDSYLAGTSAGILDAAQLGWLRDRLQESREAIVCIHHHPVRTGLAWLDRLILRNGEELTALLADCPALRGVLFGHIHRTFEGTLGGVPLLGTPSTCYQFGPRSESREIAAEPPAYRIITLEDGQMTSEVRWLGEFETAGRS